MIIVTDSSYVHAIRTALYWVWEEKGASDDYRAASYRAACRYARTAVDAARAVETAGGAL